MTRRQRLTTKNEVTLRALKIGFTLSLIDLEIQRPAFVGSCRDVTAVSSAARLNRDLQRLCFGRVHRWYVVAGGAGQRGMHAAFVQESARRFASLPTA